MTDTRMRLSALALAVLPLTLAAQGPVPFTVTVDGVALAGEVHTLPGTHPTTAVIIVGGSGYQTRADAASAVDLLADSATAVVLVDRRGYGTSGGDPVVPSTRTTATLVPRLADDVIAVAHHLRTRGHRRVGLLGSSMGGWVNVAAAARSDAIDFIVNINGGGSSVGVSDEFDRLTDEGASIADATAAARRYTGPAGYDPAPDLPRIHQPALWIYGAADDSNPTVLDVEAVTRLKEAGSPFTVLVLEATDHELIDRTTGAFNASWIGPLREFVRGTGVR